MPTFRHEEQEYATVAALIAETALPTNNDMVFIEATRALPVTEYSNANNRQLAFDQ